MTSSTEPQPRWEFYDSHQAFPLTREPRTVGEIAIGLNMPGDGTLGEFCIYIKNFGNGDVAQLAVFADGCVTLKDIDLVERLAKLDTTGGPQDTESIKALLTDMGMTDTTAEIMERVNSR